MANYRATKAINLCAGDNCCSSVADIGLMILWFTIVRLSPMTLMLAVIAMELIALHVIRDNLTLNVLMIVHPFDAIKQSQAARLLGSMI